MADIGKWVRKYQWALGTPENIPLTYYRWRAILPRIYQSIGFNITFRFLLDLFLSFNLHFEPNLMEWSPPDFFNYTTIPFKRIQKLVIGKTKYGEGIVDPPEVGVTHLERMVWTARYKSTDKGYGIERHFGSQLLFHLNTLKDYMVKYGVRDKYAEGMFEILSIVEGKMIRGAYVGFAVVDISKVLPRKSSKSTFNIRNPKDWKTYDTLKTVNVYECHVNYARVNYARVSSSKPFLKRELTQELYNRIKEFKERVNPEWQATFFLQRVDKFHYKGSGYVAILGKIYKDVKQILERHGVFGSVKMAYYSFARELYYFKYKGHKKWKYWKEILSEEDIKKKYINMGCDPTIIEEISRIV